MGLNAKRKLNNKGLSLVELIIVIGIMSIVAIAIAAFMSSGSQSYAKSSSEVDLQYEAQLATNQMQDLIIDATEYLAYEVDGTAMTPTSVDSFDSGDEKIITAVTYDKSKESTPGTFEPTAYVANIITWKKADNKLYYEQKSVTKTTYDDKEPTYAYGGNNIPETLMSEYITGLTFDVSMMDTKNVVDVGVRYERGSRKYETNHNITLRNKLLYKLVGSAGAPGGGVPTFTGTVKSVSISPKSIVSGSGTTHTFRAIVRGTGSISQMVTYNLADPRNAADLSTYVSLDTNTGKLTINSLASTLTDVPDALKKFYVTVACVDNPATTTVDESTITDVAVVSVREVTGISLTGPDEAKQGEEITLQAAITGLNVSDSTAQAVRWSIAGGGAYVTQTGNGKFKVNAAAPVGATFTINATSALNSAKSASKTVKIIEGDETTPQPTDGRTLEFGDMDSFVIRRGETKKLSLKSTNKEGCRVEWQIDFTGTDATGKAKSYDEGTVYNADKNDNGCSITVLSTFDYDSTAQICVSAYLIPNGKSRAEAVAWTGQKIGTVDKVSLKFKDGNQQGTYLSETLYYLNSEGKEIKYELLGIVGGDIKFEPSKTGYISITNAVKNSKVTLRVKSMSAVATSADPVVVTPKIGSKTLNSSISVVVAPGNVMFSSGGYDYYCYFPNPEPEEDFVTTKDKARHNDLWNYDSMKVEYITKSIKVGTGSNAGKNISIDTSKIKIGYFDTSYMGDKYWRIRYIPEPATAVWIGAWMGWKEGSSTSWRIDG